MKIQVNFAVVLNNHIFKGEFTYVFLVIHWPCPVEMVGVLDKFGTSGEHEELADHFGISSRFIVDAAINVVARKVCK